MVPAQGIAVLWKGSAEHNNCEDMGEGSQVHLLK